MAILAVAFAVAYAPILAGLVGQWSSDENSSHGLLIVPLAAYIGWTRRGRLAAATIQPGGAGLALVVASLIMLAVGVLGAELFLTRLSMVGVLVGAIAFVWSWTHVRLLAFPLAVVALAIPPPAILLNQITFPLQLAASRAGEAAIAAAGIPVLREGNLLVLADTTLEVAEACSGIRSLVSLITVALVVGYVREPRPWARMVLAAAAVPIAVFANAARVAGTGLAAHALGPQAAEGFFHTFSGWLVFVVALIMLVAVERLLPRPERALPPLREETAKEAQWAPAR